MKEAKQLIGQMLFDKVVELANQHFTDHQKKVMALTQMSDKTYNDIAEILNINYTGVSHAIKGIKSQKHGKYHGGFEKKLRKVCSKDDDCQKYLACIYELRNNDPKKALEYLRLYDPEPEYWLNFSFETEGY